MLQSSHAYASLSRPEPWGFCDRCGFRKLLCDMPPQYDWRGNVLSDTNLRVCRDTCYDQPQPNGQRPITFRPDPAPVINARPGYIATQILGTGGYDYIDDESNSAGIGDFIIGVTPIAGGDDLGWDGFKWDSGVRWE